MDEPWEILSQETAYKGRVHIINYKVALPNGAATYYEVDHSEHGAAACLIKLGEDKIVLSYQYRFPLRKWIYDLPGGGRALNETFEEAAMRECREEVGIQPNTLTYLGEFYPNPGRSDWSVQLFFCESYTHKSAAVDDPAEVVKKKILSISEIDTMIETGEIIDPTLLIAWSIAKRKHLI